MQALVRLHQLTDVALLLLRVGIGTIFIVHGTAKRRLWKVQPSAQDGWWQVALDRVPFGN